MKKRTLETIRFAPEIEVEFKNTKISDNLIKKHRIIPKWSLDYDGSLESGCEYRPKDCNKLHFNEGSIDQIKEILGLIKAHRGHIRSSCSLHVHVDASKLSNLEICNIVKAFIKVQPSIVRQFKPLRSRLHHYAKRYSQTYP